MPPVHSSLPLNPTRTPAAVAAAATIVAEPELRDLKKEATAFVPAAMRKKKAAAAAGVALSGSGVGKLNAAPDADGEAVDVLARPNLMNVLVAAGVGESPAPKAGGANKAKGKGPAKDDYAQFVEEMGDILGPVP